MSFSDEETIFLRQRCERLNLNSWLCQSGLKRILSFFCSRWHHVQERRTQWSVALLPQLLLQASRTAIPSRLKTLRFRLIRSSRLQTMTSTCRLLGMDQNQFTRRNIHQETLTTDFQEACQKCLIISAWLMRALTGECRSSANWAHTSDEFEDWKPIVFKILLFYKPHQAENVWLLSSCWGSSRILI